MPKIRYFLTLIELIGLVFAAFTDIPQRNKLIVNVKIDKTPGHPCGCLGGYFYSAERGKRGASDGYARPHHLAVEHRVLIVLHEHRLYEHAHLTDVAPQVGRLLPVVGDFTSRQDDRHVDVTVGVGIALGVGAVHDDLRLCLVARPYHSLILPDGVEGLFSCKRFSIHCVSSLVCSMKYWLISLLSVRAVAAFCSG